jgi:Mg-chelatase subunit ChlD
MDIVRLASPWVLLVALPVWAALLYAALGPRLFGRRGKEAAGVLRPLRHGAMGRAVLACLAAALLAAALAGPQVCVSREGVAPVSIVQDISASMTGADPSAAEQLLPWARALPPGRAGLVQFAASPRIIAEPFSREAASLAGPGGAAVFARPQGAAGLDETNLAAGLEAAGAALPGGQGLLLLYSDGRETRGHAVAEATRLAARGIQVFALVPPVAPRHARVASIGPASEPVAGRPVTIEVRVVSTAAAEVQVSLDRQLSETLPAARWERRVRVAPDAGTTLLFEDAALPDGLYSYQAEVRLADDAFPQQARARGAVRVGTFRTLLYVFGAKGPGPLPPMLRPMLPPGMHLRGKPVGMLTPAVMADASVIILDNVPAWSLGPQAAARLARWVTGGGLGVLALGGDTSFAAGGYADSPLEDLLPVSSRTGERPPMEIVLALDSSGSMNEKVGEVAKLALAKQAVLSLRPALADVDRLGIVAFAGEPRVVSPPVPMSQWEALKARLLALAAGGGTRITPAVEESLKCLSPRAAEDKTVRHVLLLSDGRSEDFDLPRLAALARERGATISAVATGPDADTGRLGRLASDAGGRLYATGNLGQLAETFLEDLAWARGEGLREEPRPAAWRRPEPIWRQAGPPLPPVSAWNATRAKERADVEWVAAPKPGESAVPLLASWQRGLGRAAAMPWAVASAPPAWAAGDRLGRDLASVLAWLAAGRSPIGWTARLEQRDGASWVRVEERPATIGASRSPFVAVALADAASEAGGVTLAQVAPGIHEAATGARTGEAAVFAVHREDNSDGLLHLAMPGLAPREFERLGVDRVHLQEIAGAGGGQILSAPQALADLVKRRETRGYEPVGIYLVGAAGVLVLLAIALRLAGRL